MEQGYRDQSSSLPLTRIAGPLKRRESKEPCHLLLAHLAHGDPGCPQTGQCPLQSVFSILYSTGQASIAPQPDGYLSPPTSTLPYTFHLAVRPVLLNQRSDLIAALLKSMIFLFTQNKS